MTVDLIGSLGTAVREMMPLFVKRDPAIDTVRLHDESATTTLKQRGALAHVTEVLKTCNPVKDYCYVEAMREIYARGKQRVDAGLDSMLSKIDLSPEVLNAVRLAIKNGDFTYRLATGEAVFSVNEVAVEKQEINKLNFFVNDISVNIDGSEGPESLLSAFTEQKKQDPSVVIENIAYEPEGWAHGRGRATFDVGMTVGVIEEGGDLIKGMLFEDSSAALGVFQSHGVDLSI